MSNKLIKSSFIFLIIVLLCIIGYKYTNQQKQQNITIVETLTNPQVAPGLEMANEVVFDEKVSITTIPQPIYISLSKARYKIDYRTDVENVTFTLVWAEQPDFYRVKTTTPGSSYFDVNTGESNFTLKFGNINDLNKAKLGYYKITKVMQYR